MHAASLSSHHKGTHMLEGPLPEGLTFDDVLLLPARSEVLPRETEVATLLTNNLLLNIPLVSSAMDTVTEAALAIALAQEGGIGIIHKNLSAENQAREVEKVKRSENGVIVDPITLPPTATIGVVRKVMREYNVSGVPIVDGEDPNPEHPRRRTAGNGHPKAGRLVGIMTRRDLKFQDDDSKPIGEVMTKEN